MYWSIFSWRGLSCRFTSRMYSSRFWSVSKRNRVLQASSSGSPSLSTTSLGAAAIREHGVAFKSEIQRVLFHLLGDIPPMYITRES